MKEFLLQEPEPEPRARIRFRLFLGQNDTGTVPAVPVPQHCKNLCTLSTVPVPVLLGSKWYRTVPAVPVPQHCKNFCTPSPFYPLWLWYYLHRLSSRISGGFRALFVFIVLYSVRKEFSFISGEETCNRIILNDASFIVIFSIVWFFSESLRISALDESGRKKTVTFAEVSSPLVQVPAPWLSSDVKIVPSL